MAEKFIYNLEFPPYITEFKIGDYLFKRISEYSGAFGRLQHLVNSMGSEFSTKVQTGSHQVTATVQIPNEEKLAVLPWGDEKATLLSDILLLLSLFTGRNVFLKTWEEDDGKAIMADHREHQWGSQLLLSLKYETMLKHKKTGELKTEEEAGENSAFDFDPVDIGFEKGLNQILGLISSEDWQKKYTNGYFLFLFRQAIQRQIMETSFILCWSIWEHIFTLHNKKWLNKKTIETMSGYEKISFILSEYFLVSLEDKSKKEIERLAKTRNRIIHFGLKDEKTNFKEMELFVRLTEQLMAIILGLQPSNVFNSTEKLKEFLKI